MAFSVETDWLIFAVGPQGQIARRYDWRYGRVEDVGLRGSGRGANAIHHVDRWFEFSAERPVTITRVDYAAGSRGIK